jgi:hypothetical protein
VLSSLLLVVVVALLSVELKERETLPGQELSLSPVVKNGLEVAYLPRLFVGKSVAPLGYRFPIDGPITGGYNNLCVWWDCVDPFEGIVASPHCYVNGRRCTLCSKGDSVRFLAAFDLNR